MLQHAVDAHRDLEPLVGRPQMKIAGAQLMAGSEHRVDEIRRIGIGRRIEGGQPASNRFETR